MKNAIKRINPLWVLALSCMGGVVVMTLVVMVQSLDNYFVSDDWVFLYQVSTVHTASQLLGLFTFDTDWFVRPTQWFTTWILFHTFGLNPIPFHLTSVGLNAANSVLVGVFVYRLYKMIDQNRGRIAILLSLLVSVLFLTNWRHHEAVFWWSSINELLAAFFRLGGLILATVWMASQGGRREILYVLSLVTFILALLSKESAVVFPLELILVLVFVESARQRLNWQRTVWLMCATIPFLAVALIWGGLYISTARSAPSMGVQRAGLGLLHATPTEWFFRFVQFANSNLMGTAFLSRSTALMFVEVIIFVLLVLAALTRRRLMWIFALSWTLVSVAPYVAITSNSAVSLQLPVLALGVAGDRFLYFSSVPVSLLLMVSAQWFLEEVGKLATPCWMQMSILGVVCALTVFVAANSMRLLASERDWAVSSDIVKGILHQIDNIVPNLGTGDLLCLSNLPDNYRGKYVFRNGIASAVYLYRGQSGFRVRATVEPASRFEVSTVLDKTGCTIVLLYDNANRVLQVD